MEKNKAAAFGGTSPTTDVIVSCRNWTFADEPGNFDPTMRACDISMEFNGISPNVTERIAFPSGTTVANAQTLIRARVNAKLEQTEPAVGTLPNGKIHIDGMFV